MSDGLKLAGELTVIVLTVIMIAWTWRHRDDWTPGGPQ